MPIDINFGALQSANPFAAYTAGQEIGQRNRQHQARQAAGNIFASDPDQASQILMSAGDYEGGLTLQKYGKENRLEKARTGALAKYGTGDVKGARSDALAAGDAELAAAIGKLDDDQRARVRQVNEDFGAYAQGMLGDLTGGKLTPEQAIAKVQQDKPALIALGIPEDKLDAFRGTPGEVQLIVNSALGLKGVLEQADKDRDFGLKREQFGETRRHNQATEATSRGQLGVAQGNLGLRREEHSARQSQGGYGAVAALPTGFVPD